MRRLFCFGLGYCALALIERLDGRGLTVAGTCQSEDKRQAFADRGIETYRFARAAPLPGRALMGTTHLLSSIAPDADGDPVIDRHFFDLARLEGLEWVGYLSSTSVYGDREGAWVDESIEPDPGTPRGKRRLEAERRWLDLWQGFAVPVHVFRLAGIYGPGRSAVDDVRSGRARRVVKPGHYFSRIHVADIAACLEASIARPHPGAIYNVSDDLPESSDRVVSFASSLLGREPPPAIPYDEAELSEMSRSFYLENRRIANRRMKEELGVTLAFPDYRAGLRAIAGAEV
jgi:nucleoside-diphosphate-sugar epimerase